MCRADNQGLMKRLLLALSLCLLSLIAWAATLTVALDGSQAYSSIQTAIDASNHGDTVLVYPGRYLENIRFNGKNITLASLELITGNRDYVYSTIIDANHSGTGILVIDQEASVSIRGFTVVNGSGYYVSIYDFYSGGGILIGGMTGQKRATLVNCHISGNHADRGAGLYGSGINITLSGVSITDNYASTGGALFFEGTISSNYNVSFDPVNRCNIYSNFAALGSDLYFYNVNAVHVVVDTFTVANPWNFYASAMPASPNISNPYSFDILHTVHEEVNHDLYVATWGDDSNSGLSPAEPLRNIFMAMYKIASDSLNPKCVYVEDGHYSPSRNGQIFPIPVKSYVSLVGESREGTILDGEGASSSVTHIAASSTDWYIERFTMRNAKRGIYWLRSGGGSVRDVTICDISDVYHSGALRGMKDTGLLVIENVLLSNITSPRSVYAFAAFENSGEIRILNTVIEDCSAPVNGIQALLISTRDDCDILIDGLNINNNSSNSTDEFAFNSIVQIAPFDNYGTRLRVELKNSAFYDNYQARSGQMGNIRSLNDTLFIENCTFAGNSGSGPVLYVQGTSILRNNIFHNPAMNTQLTIPNYNSSGIYSHTTLSYNNILGGSSGVYNASSQNILIWGDGNTDEDPLFSFSGNRPYSLSAQSPMVDSGWQPVSGLALDAMDASGNDRIWDGDGDGIPIIDKGAYEYQYLSPPANLSARLWQSTVELSWEMPGINRALSGYRIFRNNAPHSDIWGADNLYYREQLAASDTLQYRVAAIYGNMESAFSDSVMVIYTAVSTEDETATEQYRLSISPNPFRELAMIRYAVPEPGKVELEIYNIRGQLVANAMNAYRNAGDDIIAWAGCDDNGRPLGSGIYLVRFKHNGSLIASRKLVLIKRN